MSKAGQIGAAPVMEANEGFLTTKVSPIAHNLTAQALARHSGNYTIAFKSYTTN